MKETKLYWFSNTAYSVESYFDCAHFPNLVYLLLNITLHILNLISNYLIHWKIFSYSLPGYQIFCQVTEKCGAIDPLLFELDQ